MSVPPPLPTPSPLTQGFWDAARRHELVVQACTDCGALRHYPRERCPACHSEAWAWTPLRGTGTVYSYAVTHRAFHPAWRDRVPYAVATITLDEGVRMVTDLDAADTAKVAIGAAVEVWFDDQPDGDITIPRFRLTPDPGPTTGA